MGVRIDRLASLYIARPLLRRREQSARIPILMYHSVADEEETGVHAYYRTVTTPLVFARQMSYLHDNGYSAFGLGELGSGIERQGDSTKCVVITFDDGYRDFYVHAFPILEKHGFSATVFLPTNFVGNKPLRFRNKYCLTWNQVRELKKWGVSFGSHTVTHPQLHDVDARSMHDEIVVSKQRIEQELGNIVESFAYPFAFPENDMNFKCRLRESLQLAGYKNGVCTSIGRVDSNADHFFMKRLPVNSCDDPCLFEAKLDGAYDWVSYPQHLLKMAKQWAR